MRTGRDERRRAGVLRRIEPPLCHARGLLRKHRGEASARPGAQRVLVVGQDFQDLQVPDELEGLSRRFVHLRHAGHVACVVKRDLLRERLRERDPLLPDQLLDVVGDVEDAVRRIATPLLVIPSERPVALGTGRDEDLRAGLFYRVHVVGHELFLRRLLVAHPRERRARARRTGCRPDRLPRTPHNRCTPTCSARTPLRASPDAEGGDPTVRASRTGGARRPGREATRPPSPPPDTPGTRGHSSRTSYTRGYLPEWEASSQGAAFDPTGQVRSSSSCRAAWTACPSSSRASSSKTALVRPPEWAADSPKRIANLRPASAAISHAFVRAISFSNAYRAAPQFGQVFGIAFVSAAKPHT